MLNNCSSSAIVEVLENITPPVADAGETNTLNCNLLEWTLGGSGTTTGANISYQWQSTTGVVGVLPEITIQTPGTYTLLVTDEINGCTAESSIEVFQNLDTPVADAGDDGVLTCTSTTVTLDGSNSSQGSDITYSWYNENNVLVGDEMMVTVGQSGTYTLVVTNIISGCTANATMTVTPDANLPTADAGNNATLNCNISNVTLDGSNSSTVNGTINYSWQNETGTEIGTMPTLEVTSPGIYTLIITDPVNGCSTSSLAEVFENLTPPVVDAGLPQVITCGQSSVTLTGSGSGSGTITYHWEDPDGMFISDDSEIDVSISGTYTLIVTDGINGCTSMATVEVTPDTNLPIADAGQDATLNCSIQEN